MNWVAIITLILCGTVAAISISDHYFDHKREEREHEWSMALLEHGIDDAPDEEEGDALPDAIEEAVF
jgi:hypothetical protein